MPFALGLRRYTPEGIYILQDAFSLEANSPSFQPEVNLDTAGPPGARRTGLMVPRGDS